MRSHNSLHHLFSKSLSYTKDSDRRLSLSIPPNGTELAYHFLKQKEKMQNLKTCESKD